MRSAATAGARWTFVSFFGRQGIRTAVALLLARLLGPVEFGVVAQALLFLTFLGLFLDQGLASTLVQRKTLTDDVVGTGLWLNVAVTVGLAAATFGAAPLVAQFFSTPEVASVLRVLCISVMLQGLVVVPQALLARRLRMRALAIREVAAAAVGGAAGITAAALDAGYWSIVVQTLTTDLIVFVATIALVGRLPVLASRAAVRDIWGMSVRVFFIQMLTYIQRNLDNVLVGRFLGAASLAQYSIAYRTMMVPIQGFTFAANRVTLPVFSRMQGDPERLRLAFLDVVLVLATATMPLMALSAAAAPVGIPLLLGDAWKPAVVPVQLLAVTGMRQGITSAMGPVMLASGRATTALRLQIVNTIGCALAFAVGLRWGITGVAAAYTAMGFFVLGPLSLVVTSRVLDLSLRVFGRTLLPTATASSALCGAFVLVMGLTDPLPDLARLLVAGVAGSGIYVTVLRVLWPQHARRILLQVRDVLGAGSTSASSSG